MRQFITAILIGLFISSAVGQIRAITETGEEVVLNNDGTWKYITFPEESDVQTNPEPFEKQKSAKFLVKSKIADFGIWISPRKWKFEKAEEGAAAEFEFTHKKEELSGMAIIESVEMPIQSLRNMAIENAISAAPDLELVKEEYRIVNGVKRLHLVMTGTIQGIGFTYCGYYYSGSEGTIQLIGYSYDRNVPETIAKMELLINGLVNLE